MARSLKGMSSHGRSPLPRLSNFRFLLVLTVATVGSGGYELAKLMANHVLGNIYGKEKEGLYQWLRDIEVRLRERETPRRTQGLRQNCLMQGFPYLPSWTAMVCPTKEGKIVERRDHVLMTCFCRRTQGLRQNCLMQGFPYRRHVSYWMQSGARTCIPRLLFWNIIPDMLPALSRS